MSRQKNAKSRIVIMLLCAVMCALSAAAQKQFVYNGLKYTVIDEAAKTVELSAPMSLDDVDLVIPETVTDEETETTYTVTEIGRSAFRMVYSFRTLTMPNTITKIDDMAFQYCKLVSVKLSENLQSIGSWAFAQNTLLKSIEIPSSVKGITSRLPFRGCLSLTSITIGNTGLNYGYEGCENLEYIVIRGKDLSNVDLWGDIDFTNNVEIYVDEDMVESAKSHELLGKFKTILPITETPEFSVDGIRYIVTNPEEKTVVISDIDAGITNPLIPEKVSNGKYTYTVNALGTGAFIYGGDIETLNIPENIKKFGFRSFYGCDGIKSLTIPASVTEIEDLPSFSDIQSVVYLAEHPLETNSSFSKTTTESGVLYVLNEAALAEAKVTKPWNTFSNIQLYNASGVEDIVTEGCGNLEVYDLKGIKIGNSIDGLSPGVYIVRKGSETSKYVVK